MSEQGRVEEVTIDYVGDVLVADAAIGATTLNLNDAADFDEFGGSLQINGLTYTYTTKDDLLDTVTLPGPGLTVAALADDAVRLYPLVEEKIATISIPNFDDAVRAVIPFAMSNMFDPGIREAFDQESVLVEMTTEGWVIQNVIANIPLVKSTGIDLGTGGLHDGLPPSYSPTIRVLGGVKSVFIQADPITNPDPVQYEYHLSTTSGAVTAGNVATVVHIGPENMFVARYLADGVTELAVGTTYYAHVFAKDLDGYGPMSLEASGSPVQITGPDIAVNAVTAAKILAGEITADKFAATLAMVSTLLVGSNITLRPTESSLGAGDSGLVVSLANGGIIQLPADGSAAQFLKVALEATSILVQDNFELRGAVNKIAGSLDLSVGADTPTIAPTAAVSWADTVHIPVSNTLYDLESLVDDSPSQWLTIQANASLTTYKIYAISKTTGAKTVVTTLPAGFQYQNLMKVGTDYYVRALPTPSGGNYTIRKFNSSWVFQSSFTEPTSGLAAGALLEAVTTNGTNFFWLYTHILSGGDSHRRVYSTPLTSGTVTLVMTSVNADGAGGAGASGLYVGNGDYGSLRYLVSLGSTANLYNSAGARQTSEEFTMPNGEGSFGNPIYDGANFLVLGFTHVWKLSGNKTGATRSVRYSKYDNDPTNSTHETPWSPASPVVSHPARSWLKVTSPSPGGSGGVDDPDVIRHYIQTGGAGSFYLQTPDVVAPWTMYYGAVATSGATAVSTPDFTGVDAPGILKSKAELTAGNPLTYFSGKGDFALRGVSLDDAVFTPGWLASDGVTLNIVDGTLTGKKTRYGKWVYYEIYMNRGASSSNGNAGVYYKFSVGDTFDTSIIGTALVVHGSGWIRDNSANSERVVGVRAVSTTEVALLDASNTNNNPRVGRDTPWVWATGDIITFSFWARIV